jgi:hypothetical protein
MIFFELTSLEIGGATQAIPLKSQLVFFFLAVKSRGAQVDISGEIRRWAL